MDAGASPRAPSSASVKLVHKMTVLLVLAASAVLVAYGYVTVSREERMLEESVVRDARMVARVMRRSFIQESRSEGRDAAFKLLQHASASEEKVQFEAYSLDELRSGEDLRAPELDRQQVSQLEAGHEVLVLAQSPPVLRIYLPVTLPGEPPLALLLEESTQQEREYATQTRVHIATATLALVLLLGLIAYSVGSKVVGRPLRMLTEKAERVGQGDLTGPVLLRQSDEIGQLAQTMNRMCEDLTQETTHRLEALEQLRHAERLATVGRLASGIAHELGTPLNVVLGRAMLNVEGQDDGDSPSSADNSRIIVEQTERMIGIIRQLLDFARRGTTETHPADMREVVGHVAELLSPLAKEANVRLTLELPEEKAVALVDPNQVEQALTNLVVNAVQASPPGGQVDLRVEVVRLRPPSGGPEDPYVRVSVTDHGEGVSTNDRARIFEPFFTTKDVGQGTGLGLPVAHGIVSDHGGWIDVESTPGAGSRFSAQFRTQEASA